VTEIHQFLKKEGFLDEDADENIRIIKRNNGIFENYN
jgi:hypothetical protein